MRTSCACRRAGFGPAVLVAKIRSSATAFDTSVVALLALAENGVPEEEVAAMLAAAPGAAPSAPGREAVRSAPAAPGAQPQAIPGSTFRESLRAGGEGPAMVVIPAGRFRMGCLSNDDDCQADEKPVHEVTIGAPFALSVYAVTFEEYDRFTYPNKVADEGWGRGRRPVIRVSWNAAQDYVEFLSAQTGAEYRLPSEAEWEYAARAGSTTRANCNEDLCCDRWENTAPVRSFCPNGFGLYDMSGNVWEWVADCWNVSYAGAPSDGSVWESGDCARSVVRGGSWSYFPGIRRSANRDRYAPGVHDYSYGFRVARTLTP